MRLAMSALEAMVSVAVAIIGATQGVMIAMLGRVKRDAKESRDQVANTHDTNLREEMDDRHEELSAGLAKIENRISEVADQIKGVNKDVGRLDTRDIDRGHDVRELRSLGVRNSRSISALAERLTNHERGATCTSNSPQSL